MSKPEICFILYKPAVPGNIGATARAMKTMGFEQLRLIDPADPLQDEAKMMAHGSTDLLENAQIFKDFTSAVSDLDFVISTTAKSKSGKVDYIPAAELPGFLAQKAGTIEKVGIVFGTEESGLPNSILLNSNIGVTIPMAVTYPSLNLAQSVMVIAYELGTWLHAKMETLNDREGTNEQEWTDEQEAASWKELQQRSEEILSGAGIKPGTPLYHRIIERMSFLKASDARLVHSISSRLKDLLDKAKS